MLFDNTTVTGSWVQLNASNLTAACDKYSRIINNVTMSMPHAGVFSAAHDAKNGILQPEDLAGVGEYSQISALHIISYTLFFADKERPPVYPTVRPINASSSSMNRSVSSDARTRVQMRACGQLRYRSREQLDAASA